MLIMLSSSGPRKSSSGRAPSHRSAGTSGSYRAAPKNATLSSPRTAPRVFSRTCARISRKEKASTSRRCSPPAQPLCISTSWRTLGPSAEERRRGRLARRPPMRRGSVRCGRRGAPGSALVGSPEHPSSLVYRTSRLAVAVAATRAASSRTSTLPLRSGRYSSLARAKQPAACPDGGSRTQGRRRAAGGDLVQGRLSDPRGGARRGRFPSHGTPALSRARAPPDMSVARSVAGRSISTPHRSVRRPVLAHRITQWSQWCTVAPQELRLWCESKRRRIGNIRQVLVGLPVVFGAALQPVQLAQADGHGAALPSRVVGEPTLLRSIRRRPSGKEVLPDPSLLSARSDIAC